VRRRGAKSMPKPRTTRVTGMSKGEIVALLLEEPRVTSSTSHALASYLSTPPRLSGAEYDAWVERLCRRRPYDASDI